MCVCREKVKHMVDSFVRDVQQAREDFVQKAPYGIENLNPDAANYFIRESKVEVENYRKQASSAESMFDYIACACNYLKSD